MAQSEVRFAASAAQWMGCFYPGTKAAIQGDQVALEGEYRPDELKRMWRAALLNEQLHGQNDRQRRKLLADLTQ